MERQLLAFSSVFISLWTGSLLIDQGNRTRILTDVMILGGLGVSLYALLSLNNLPLILFAGIAVCSVVVHLLVLSVHSIDGRLASPPTYKPEPEHAEKDIEHTL